MKWLLLIKVLAVIISFILRVFIFISHIIRSILSVVANGLRNIARKLLGRSAGIQARGQARRQAGVLDLFFKGLGLILSILHKIICFIHGIFNRLYWLLRVLYNKLYWFFKGIHSKTYWWKHDKKSKMYQKISRHKYLDLLVIFVKNNLSGTKKQLLLIPIEDVRTYIKNYAKSSVFRVVEREKYRKVCIPEVFEKSKGRIEEYLSEKIYVAQIRNVEIIGASDVVLAGNCLLNDAVKNDKEERLDIRYSAIKKIIKDTAVVESGEVERKIERGINLVGAASFNYYHLMVEILSRLTFVDLYEDYRDYPILVDEVVLRIPQFATALGYFNRYNHKVIAIDKEQRCFVRDMVLPSHTVWMPINLYNRNDIRVSDFLIADTVLKNIRSLVPLYQMTKPWRKIFISRKNTKALRLKNEERIRRIFQNNGFEIVYTEEMTFEEQVECFGKAKCVVATSGAALTNIIFCQPGTVIGCIIPSYHRFYMYSTIAYYLGLKPVFMDAEITELTPYAAADTFELDEKYATRYAKKITRLL